MPKDVLTPRQMQKHMGVFDEPQRDRGRAHLTVIENDLGELWTSGEKSYKQYQTDPVGFIENECNEAYGITRDQKAICQSVVDVRKTIVKSSNATGKTYIAARIGTWFYKTFPDSQVWTAAAPPEDNLDKLLWGRIGELSDNAPGLFESDAVTFRMIARSKASYMTGQPIPKVGTDQQRLSAWSGKHAPHILFIIDEGDGVPQVIYEAIDTCMSGGHARLLVLFNPREASGVLYDWERRGEARVLTLEAFNHPNVVTGEDLIPGCVTRNDTVLSIIGGSRVLAEHESAEDITLRAKVFTVPDFLVGATAVTNSGGTTAPLPDRPRVIKSSFLAYKVLARYPMTQDNQVVPTESYESARLRWDRYTADVGPVPEAIRPLIGVDVAEGVEVDPSAMVLRYGSFVAQTEIRPGINSQQIARWVIAKAQRTHAETVYVDAVGFGAGVVTDIEEGTVDGGEEGFVAGLGRHRVVGVKTSRAPTKKMMGLDGKPKGEFGKLRDQLLWEVGLFVQSDDCMLPPSETLRDDLLALRWKVDLITGKIVISNKKDLRERLSRSTDELDALKMTLLGRRKRMIGKGFLVDL